MSRYSSLLSRLTFYWPNGLVNLPTYEYFTQIDDRQCSLCNQVHPFDALSCLAQCAHLSYARSLSFDVWPLPIQHIVSNWYTHASRDDKRKAVCTLLPRSLISRFDGIVGLQLRAALAFRKPKLAPLSNVKRLSLPPATPYLSIGNVDPSTTGRQALHSHTDQSHSTEPPPLFPLPSPSSTLSQRRNERGRIPPPQGSLATPRRDPNQHSLHHPPSPYLPLRRPPTLTKKTGFG